MKQIGQAQDPALRAAIERIEQARAARVAGSPPAATERAQEAPPRRSTPIGDLAAERAKRRDQDAAQLVRLAKRMGIAGEALAVVQRGAASAKIDAQGWIFVMISPAQNAAVVEWLSQHSRRPQVAVRLWAQLLGHLRSDTGEITQTRAQLAERIGIEPRTLSELMTELETIRAIRREKEGRKVRYFLSPHIATHLPGPARQAAQASAPPLLVLMEGKQPPA
jgi:DNA-binding transcriptional ArsR family regulator